MELESLNLLGQITNSFFRVKRIPCNFVHLDVKFQKSNVSSLKVYPFVFAIFSSMIPVPSKNFIIRCKYFFFVKRTLLNNLYIFFCKKRFCHLIKWNFFTNRIFSFFSIKKKREKAIKRIDRFLARVLFTR